MSGVKQAFAIIYHATCACDAWIFVNEYMLRKIVTSLMKRFLNTQQEVKLSAYVYEIFNKLLRFIIPLYNYKSIITFIKN